MKLFLNLLFLGRAFFLGICLLGTNAMADVVAVGPGDFPPGTITITFEGIPDGTEVGGLIVNGVLFEYTLPVGLGGVMIDGGPGVTNHITPPNAVTYGDNVGVAMSLFLPAPATMFGYGFALDTFGPVTNATAIILYDGFNILGSLSFDGNSDPNFTGGFAGIQSTIPFNRADMWFNYDAAPAWAFDNIMIYATPEPGTLVLLGGGLPGMVRVLRHKVKF